MLEIQSMRGVKSAAKSNDYQQRHMLWNVHILPFHWNFIVVTNVQDRGILSAPHQSHWKL